MRGAFCPSSPTRALRFSPARWLILAGALAVVGITASTEPLFAQAPESEGDIRTAVIRWGAVPGAREYLIQIRNEREEIVADERVRENSYRARLDPGRYEQRIAAVNRAGRSGQWSRWTPLEIRASRAPVIGPIRPVGPLQNGRQTLRIDGVHFTPETKILLKSEGELKPVSVRYVGPGAVEIQLDSLNLEDGEYAIVAENPREQRTERFAAAVVAGDRVSVPSEAQQPTPDYERARDENEREGAERPAPPEAAPPGLFTTIIPGLPAYNEGRNSEAGLWAGGVAGALLLSAYQYQRGVSIRENFESELLTRFFTDPVVFAAATQSGVIANRPSTAEIGAVIYAYVESRNAAAASYQRVQQEQLAVGLLAALAWGGHFLWENRERFFLGDAEGDEVRARLSARSARPFGEANLDVLRAADPGTLARMRDAARPELAVTFQF
jgi:hypothetical protein